MQLGVSSAFRAANTMRQSPLFPASAAVHFDAAAVDEQPVRHLRRGIGIAQECLKGVTFYQVVKKLEWLATFWHVY